MTNYNERLDGIIERIRYAVYYADYHANHTQEQINMKISEHIDEQKQAITSLTKELVAEAKPEKKSTEDYGSWEDGHRNAGWNKCLDQFEQNLLKALEEKL